MVSHFLVLNPTVRGKSHTFAAVAGISSSSGQCEAAAGVRCSVRRSQSLGERTASSVHVTGTRTSVVARVSSLLVVGGREGGGRGAGGNPRISASDSSQTPLRVAPLCVELQSQATAVQPSEEEEEEEEGKASKFFFGGGGPNSGGRKGGGLREREFPPALSSSSPLCRSAICCSKQLQLV